MEYRIIFEFEGSLFEHGAIPHDGESLECIPNVGDFVEFTCQENGQDGGRDSGIHKVESRKFSYGYAGADQICDIFIMLK